MADDMTATTAAPETGASEIPEQTAQRRRRRSAVAGGIPSPASVPASAGRISFPVLETGAIDWEKATDDTREKLRRAGFNDPRTPAAATVPGGELLTPELVGGLIDGFSSLMQMIGRVGFKFDQDVAALAFQFTPDQKAGLTPGVVAVVNQYGGDIMGKHAPACMLGTAVCMMLTAQINYARELQARKHGAPTPVLSLVRKWTLLNSCQ